MLKAIIFDMDGVLIDSEPVHFEANKKIMKGFGHDLEYEYYKQFIGSTLTHMWQVLKEDYGIEDEIESLNKMSEQGSKDIIGKDGYIKIPGACELVEMFRKNKLRLAVASSSAPDIIDNVVSSLGIKQYFDILVSGMNVAHPKPAPDIFLNAAELLEVDSSECMVIEDSANGVNAARSAGMTCVGYINPNSGVQDLSNAHYLVESFVGLDMSFFNMVYCHANGEP
ncbi:MAG: HAD family phosphatase [Lachnospiraceae bacterium]|nr:HAD family phosphatase [Lachnospiraceae bacterium]